MSPSSTACLGLVAYVWGRGPQDRLLVEWLGPEAARLRREGLATGFWFDRYDARGPHVFSLFTVPCSAREEILPRITQGLAAHLAAHPSREALSPERLEKLHAQTRGRRQCEADGWPGFAANNSFVTFDHPARGYPFWLSAAAPEEEEIWNQAAEASLWAISRLAAGLRPLPPAVRWVEGVDRALREAGEDPGAYWRHHVSTLLLAWDGEAGDEDLALLAEALGEGQKRTFARLWEEAERTADGAPPAAPLVRLILAAPAERRWPLLREIDHVTLKQLGLPVILHAPLALYAWLRSRSS
ncbi:MAG TPA: hypothetical protein VG477_12695 [Thermoanaerobaculia bacterium]|nr:hypothetical protein [Thermoanaerobaculia bacterium]